MLHSLRIVNAEYANRLYYQPVYGVSEAGFLNVKTIAIVCVFTGQTPTYLLLRHTLHDLDIQRSASPL